MHVTKCFFFFLYRSHNFLCVSIVWKSVFVNFFFFMYHQCHDQPIQMWLDIKNEIISTDRSERMITT